MKNLKDSLFKTKRKNAFFVTSIVANNKLISINSIEDSVLKNVYLNYPM